MSEIISPRGSNVALITLGCKVNQYESERIAHDFQEVGYTIVGADASAGVVVINTCAVTVQSERKSRKAVRRAVKDNPDAYVIVTGCSSELQADAYANIEGVDRVVSGQEKMSLPAMFEVIREVDTPFSQWHTRSLLKIQDGCDHYCSYCIVPHVRGRNRSVPLSDVVTEAGRLIEGGAKELVLTGINLGLYGRDLGDVDLEFLIRRLQTIEELVRIRLSSIELAQISDELVAQMIPKGKLCRHLHIPLQSGSDTILRMMNRPYTSEEILGRVTRIKSIVSSIALVFDVMVGFPGETEADFAASLELIEACQPARLHIFQYSPRPRTPAADMIEQIPEQEKKSRSQIMKDLDARLRNVFLQRSLNQTLPAIVERGDNNSDIAMTDNYIPVSIPAGSAELGSSIYVRIDTVDEDKAKGAVIDI